MRRPGEICRPCGGHAGYCPCEDKEGCAHESWEEYPPPGQRRPGQGFSRKCADCKQVLEPGREPEATEAAEVPVGVVEPPVCACGHDAERHVAFLGDCNGADGAECWCANFHKPPAEPEPRPMQAVAYGVGGQLYELMTHPDAIVRVENGVLSIQHANGTPAIVQVRTVRVQ